MKKILIIFASFLLLTSCSILKKTKESSFVQTEKSEIKKDSVSAVETNKAIKDNITINVPESSNPETQKELIELLKRMNTSKNSGDNSYKLWYDEQLKQLRAEFEIGETQNKTTDVNESEKTEISIEEQIDTYIKKRVNNPYLLLIIAFLLRAEIYAIIRWLFPKLNTIKSIKDIFSKNREYRPP